MLKLRLSCLLPETAKKMKHVSVMKTKGKFNKYRSALNTFYALEAFYIPNE